MAENKENDAVQFLYACIRGDRAALIKHLQSGKREEINSCRQDGWTAIHYASSAGKKEILEVLALWGANLNCVTAQSNSTPLHLAAKRGNLQIVQTLLELGANPELIDSNGWTARDLAQACGNETISALLRLKENSRRFSDSALLSVNPGLETIATERPRTTDSILPNFLPRNALEEIKRNEANTNGRFPPNPPNQIQGGQREGGAVIMEPWMRSSVVVMISDQHSSGAETPAMDPKAASHKAAPSDRLARFRARLEPLRAALKASVEAGPEQPVAAAPKATRIPQGDATLECLQQAARRLTSWTRDRIGPGEVAAFRLR